MPSPQPGQPVRGSSTGRPIMALLDLLGRRWTLRIIWEMRGESVSYVDLRTRCDSMSTSVLSQRLNELKDADIIMQSAAGNYSLSEEGRNLLEALSPLNDWANRWSERK
ncbi:MAG: helix-turn-helix transcriptional regulator [Chitinophagaceae bacterium]|nr:helix-turn-helix transcriptional regulator [Anaerolineae bacterium]